MNGKMSIAWIMTVSLIALSACNPPMPGPSPTPVDLQATLDFMLASTLTAAVTDTPAFTATPSETPLPSLTPTPSVTPSPLAPLVSVSGNTNCRTGNATVYDLVFIMMVGQTAEVVGRDAYGQYWVIQDPSHPTRSCWLWGHYATVTGDWSALPIVTPPPSPTPPPNPPGFTATYLSVTHCAPDYAFRFQVNNTGSITWESIRIVVTDNTTATTFTHILDSFRSYNGCGLESSVLSLAPGAGTVVANVNPGQFSYNPAGHSITATVTVCSANGLGGTCLNQTINFTP
jgi:hypothetical protein